MAEQPVLSAPPASVSIDSLVLVRRVVCSYVARRVGFLVLTLWAAITLNFVIPRLMPGNPAQVMLAHIATKGPINPSLQRDIAASLGLPGGSVWSQYWQYLDNVVHFRFGVSYAYFPQQVTSLIRESLPWTVLLVGTSTIISFLVGSALGVTAAWRRSKKFDSITTTGSTFISNFPYYVVGMLFVYVFALRLNLLPLSGGSDNPPSWSTAFASDALRHAVLPALSIFIGGVGVWTLSMRNYTINVLGEDYIRFAQANGVRTRTILLRYAAKNAVLPQLTVFAIVFGNVVGGSLLVEEVFGYPGVGTLLINAIFNLDYPLMQALFLIITVCVLLANFLVDVLHLKLDPRTAG